MDLRDQLKNLFPDHIEEEVPQETPSTIWLQDEPLLVNTRSAKANL